MRRFLTIGIKPDKSIKVLAGADEEKGAHIDTFNALASSKKKKQKAEFSEIHVIDISKGIVKRKRFGNGEGGKRTVARTVKKKASRKKAKPAAKKKKAAAKKSSAKITAKAKAPAPTAKNKEAGSGETVSLPPAKAEGE